MIISRTNKLAEVKSNKNLLTKSRYYYISHLAREFIMKNSISTLPVDIFAIIKKNNWKLITYSSLIENKISEYNEIMKNNLGFAQNFNGNAYAIFYDDRISEHSQRFTLAHEIGHILLNHFKISIENREQEANMFAVRLLMPICLLHECHIRSAIEISKLCNVSLISANYRYDRLIILEERNKFYTDPKKIKVKKRYKKFIKTYKKEKRE